MTQKLEKQRPLYIIDGCAPRGLYVDKERIIGILIGIKQDICRADCFIEKVSAFCKFCMENDVKSIDEVAQERRAHCKLMSYTFSEYTGLIDNDGLERYNAVMQAANRFVNVLEQNLILPSSFTREEAVLYRYALHESRRFHSDKRLCMGNALQTDKKLIATAVALASNREVILVSEDSSLKRAFRETLDSTIKGTGAIEEGMYGFTASYSKMADTRGTFSFKAISVYVPEMLKFIK